MDGILAALGAGSGLQTGDIITGLVAAERDPKAASIESQRESIDARVSALGQVRAGLSAFSSALAELSNSGILGVQPQLSRPDLASATVTSRSANPQNISFSVEAMATSQTVVSSALSATDAAATGTGSLTIMFGALTQDGSGQATAFTPADPPRAITIDINDGETNLSAIADKINELAPGMNATVLNDGGTQRLILKGSDGAENGFTVDVDTTPGNPLEKLGYNVGVAGGMSATKAATDAELIVEGIPITRSSNRITDLLDGVTLTLTKAAPGEIIDYAADFDQAELSTAVQNFAGAYNELNGLMNELSARAADGGEAGPLNGSRPLRELQRDLRELTTQILSADSGPQRLADIGISITRDGSLQVNTSVLETAIQNSPQQVASMFHDNQSLNVSGVTVVGDVSNIPPGRYEFSNITAATSGSLSGGGTSASILTPWRVDALNKDIRISVDGTTSLTIPLVEGDYTDGNAFATMMTDAIQADSLLGTLNASAVVTWDGTRFTITSGSVGSSSTVAITEMNLTLSTQIGFDATTDQPGTDATGDINGITVTGDGNRLTVPPGQDGAGLQFDVSGDAAGGVIEISHGLQTRLSDIADALADANSPFGSVISGLGRQRSRLDTEEQALTARLITYEDRLRAQFGAMEAAVAGFKATQDFLEQQIDLWSNQNS